MKIKKIKLSYEEIICSAAARELNDGDIVFVGQGYPILAALLAKKSGKNLTLIMEGGIIEFDLYRPPIHIADMTSMKGCAAACELIEIFTYYLFGGYIDVGFLGASQIDKYGNINTSYQSFPDKRIAGSGGANEIGGYAKKIVIIMRHGRFVDKLPYITTPGWLDGGNSREEAGLPGGPYAVITRKGVFKFEKDTKEIYLESIHPNVNLKKLLKSVPWDLKVADDLKTTPLPTEEELNILRNWAPGVSIGRARWGFRQLEFLRNLSEERIKRNLKFKEKSQQTG
ncbi:MAG: CoA-transferase subunit beta [Candidatus Helarchaeota archaeon]